VVASIKDLTTKKGDRMAFVNLEDLTGFVEMVVFPEVYQASAELLKSEEPLLVSGTVDMGEESCKLLVTEVLSLKEVKERLTKRLHFRLTTPGLDDRQLRSLKELMTRYRGNCDALIHLVIPNRSETVITLPDTLRVQASDEMVDDVEKLFGYNVVTFE